jgi:hypothetical protein
MKEVEKKKYTQNLDGKNIFNVGCREECEIKKILRNE